MCSISTRTLSAIILQGALLGAFPSFTAAQMSQITNGDAKQTVGFDQVQPILRKRCQNCHNSEELRGDLSVSDMTALQAGSSSGPVIVAGKPKKSLLYTTAAHLDEPTMPPNSRKIRAKELETIRRWIEDGLVLKSGDTATKQPSDEPSDSTPNMAETDTSGQIESELKEVEPVLQSSALAALATQPESNFVAISGQEQIVLWDIQSGDLSGIPFTEPEITQLSFTTRGSKLIASGGTPGLSGSIFGFDVATGKQLFRIADETDSILALSLSPDGSQVAFGGPSKLLKICDIGSGEVLHTLRKHTDWVLTAAYSPDGLLIASGDRFGGLFVWEAMTGEVFHSLKGHAGPVHALAWDTDGETLLSAGEDGQIRVWNMHHGELTATWDAGVGAILDLDRQTGLTFAGGRNGKATLWRTPLDKIAEFDTKEQIDHARILASSNRAVAVDSLGQIHELSLPSLAQVNTLALPTKQGAIEELRATLAVRSEEFQQERHAEMAALALAEKQPSEIQINNQDQNMETDLDSNDLARSLTDQLAMVETSLKQAVAQKESILKQQAALDNLLDQQNTQIELQQQQVASLSRLLDAVKSKLKPEDRERVLAKQLAEQRAIFDELAELKVRVQAAANQSAVLPKEAQPTWGPNLQLLNELSKNLTEQIQATESRLGISPQASRTAMQGQPSNWETGQ